MSKSKKPKTYSISETLRLMEDQPKDWHALDKRKSLAQLCYGSEANVVKEIAAANKYRSLKGKEPLVTEGRVTDPKTGKTADRSYIWTKATDKPTGGSSHNSPYNRLEADYIRNRTKSSISKKIPDDGYMGGEVKSPVEILGHELTHAITRHDITSDHALGRGQRRKDKGDLDYFGTAKKQYRELSYPEYNPREFSPALAAMTRLEYQTTGKRITTPEQFDKKIAEYDAKSPEEKVAFRKSLPTEVSRFYGHIDTVSSPEAKDIKLWGIEGKKEKTGEKVRGPDRRKRFLDISRDMIPSLVKRQESADKLLKRRRV